MAKKNTYGYFKPQKPKKSFGESLRSIFRKTMLTATAGTAIAGYHHYGTHEDVQVLVTAVERANTAEGQTPYTVIHTDQGVFINTETLLHLKGEDATQQINNQLRPGARLTLRVYGLNPTVGNWGLHNFGIHRNVLNADAIVTATTAATPPAPTRAPILPVPLRPRPTEPALRTVEGVVPDTNLSAPQSCADTDNLADMREKNPQIYRDLSYMERLPITGRPVFDVMTNRDNAIRACLTPYNPRSDVNGTFQAGTIRVMRGMSSPTTLHEYFHALQYLHLQADDGDWKLTMKDYAVANALKEAASVGYSLMVEREAHNRGMTLGPAAEGINYGSAHTFDGTRAVFDQAYDRAYTANSHMDGQARERAALEAGGQAAVLALMLGDDTSWLDSYSGTIAQNVNNNSSVLSPNSAAAAGYSRLRTSVYSRMGKVSDSVNIIPQEFLGADAQRNIDRTFRILGLRITSNSDARPPRTLG